MKTMDGNPLTTTNWDRDIVSKLMELGIPNEYARLTLGLFAEERMLADRQGYERGFNNGYEIGSKKFLTHLTPP